MENKQNEKSTEEELNYEMYKSGCIGYKKFAEGMARYFISHCDRSILIKALKKRKIIKQDWNEKGEVYVEAKDEKLKQILEKYKHLQLQPLVTELKELINKND